MEETRRRNEASLARKRAAGTKGISNAAGNGGATSEGTQSPTSTGAMDSLLEKLRAAAPQARDQRDRRRRARLRDRHQIRVASGQTITDLSELTKEDNPDVESDKSILSPNSTTSGEGGSEKISDMTTISEGEDVADRAASMLQGLRGDGDTEPSNRSSSNGSLRVRRLRQSADDERRTRRNRRRTAATNMGDDKESPLSPGPDQEPKTIPEEPPEGEERPKRLAPPTTIVSPPSPEGTRNKPVEIEDD